MLVSLELVLVLFGGKLNVGLSLYLLELQFKLDTECNFDIKETDSSKLNSKTGSNNINVES